MPLNTNCLVGKFGQMAKAEDDGIIARRTRSKLSLNNTPLDAIEASFVAPDITPDLYDEATLFGDDAEWQTFLTKLMKSEGGFSFYTFCSFCIDLFSAMKICVSFNLQICILY